MWLYTCMCFSSSQNHTATYWPVMCTTTFCFFPRTRVHGECYQNVFVCIWNWCNMQKKLKLLIHGPFCKVSLNHFEYPQQTVELDVQISSQFLFPHQSWGWKLINGSAEVDAVYCFQIKDPSPCCHFIVMLPRWVDSTVLHTSGRCNKPALNLLCEILVNKQ